MKYFFALPLCGLLLTHVVLAQMPATFAPVATYSVGAGSRTVGIAVTDVNGDSRPDLLTANFGSSTAGVQLGTGNGTFGAVTTYSTGVGSTPYSITVADVNGDGKPDLLTANNGSSTAGVLLGTGTGTFGTAATYSSGPGSNPYNIAVADVNGDGKPDLLTANYNDKVGVLLGTGTGTFGNVTTYSTGTGSYPDGIVAADVNGDGKLDLLTANNSTNSAGVLLGTGTGTFGNVTTYSTGPSSGPLDIAVADVNGDGKPDLLTANHGSDSAGVLLGTGTGTFGAVTNYSTGAGSSPNGITVADVNGDGRPDLLTANTNTSAAGILLGTGTGTFGAIATVSTGAGSGPYTIAVADVNADGRPDVLTANSTGNTAGVLLNTTPLASTGAFGTAYSVGTVGKPFAVVVADVNADGRPDLLTANTDDSMVGVLLSTGLGTFGAVTTFSTGAGTNPLNLAVADVNRDGRLDLLTANGGGTSNSVGVLLGTGGGSFGAATIYSTGIGSAPLSVVVADVNTDGQPDLLTANFGSSTVGVFLGNGTGTFGAVATFSTGSSSNPYSLAVADVNRDGKPDLLTANTFSNTAGVLLGTGTGSFGTVATYSTGTGSQPQSIAVADVNADGRPDLLTALYAGSAAGVLLGTGTGTFGAITTYNTGAGSQPTTIVVAEVNTDGRPDLLVSNGGSNTMGVLLGIGVGTGAFGAVATYSTGAGSTPYSLVAADVNGDGKPDLLTANRDSRTVSILLNTGTLLATRPALPGANASLAPNPTSASASLAATGLLLAAHTLEATLYNALGQAVRRLTLPAAAGTVTADIATAGLPAGGYLLRLRALDARGAALGTLPTQHLQVE